MYGNADRFESEPISFDRSVLTGDGLEERVRLLDSQLKILRGALRSRWQGGEGGAWLAVIEEMEDRLDNLSFYIDCRECSLPESKRVTKHSRSTGTEKEILTMAAHGMTNAEIARKLGLSVSTVGARFVTMYRRMGVKSRSHAIAKAMGFD
jgi:DNA-binding NarL/FixJ family response regulator